MVVGREQAVERDELKLEGKLCRVSLREQPPSVGCVGAALCSVPKARHVSQRSSRDVRIPKSITENISRNSR